MKPGMVILMALLAACVALPGAFNYAGVCLPQMKIIPEIVLIEGAASKVNSDSAGDLLAGGGDGLTFVPYKDGRDLIQQNPGCCVIDAELSDALSRMAGRRVVKMDYMAVYADASGKQTKQQMHSLVVVGNCGSLN